MSQSLGSNVSTRLGCEVPAFAVQAATPVESVPGKTADHRHTQRDGDR